MCQEPDIAAHRHAGTEADSAPRHSIWTGDATEVISFLSDKEVRCPGWLGGDVEEVERSTEQESRHGNLWGTYHCTTSSLSFTGSFSLHRSPHTVVVKTCSLLGGGVHRLTTTATRPEIQNRPAATYIWPPCISIMTGTQAMLMATMKTTKSLPTTISSREEARFRSIL
ncbi:hypothetical protein JZ751_029115 [Albula glossodonta]|uniref:Uncharacterized protein n=1 Tax=Albula glossodonta TaxID=121402 RepID=A0A8T2PH41_9TELE|nr:hypothetical protein JZ751_029115 [Albula glossodonta]